MNKNEIANVIKMLADVLQARHWRMATAESCTGGWISKCCTDLAGSSAWFDRGFVTYCNEAKVDMLQVENEVLKQHGAVSEAIARQMARGARRVAGVEVPFVRHPNIEARPDWATVEMRQQLAYWRTRYASGVQAFDRRLGSFLDFLREQSNRLPQEHTDQKHRRD